MVEEMADLSALETNVMNTEQMDTIVRMLRRQHGKMWNLRLQDDQRLLEELIQKQELALLIGSAKMAGLEKAVKCYRRTDRAWP